MYCMYCGAQVPEGTRFCKRCGKPLSPSVPAAQAAQTKTAAKPRKGKVGGKWIALAAGLCVVLAVVCLLIFSGKRPLSAGALRKAVESCEEYAWTQAKTKDFKVVKRQTNKRAGTDTAWVTIEGEADTYTVTRSFELRSTRYNDGWELDQIVPWYNPDAPDAITPTVTPTEEQVLQDVQNESLPDFSSFPYDDIVSCEVTGVRQGEGGDNTWYADITYCCGVIDEFVTLPVYYTYDENTVEWTHTFGEGWDIDRSGRVCPDICGFWSCSNSEIEISFWIDPVDDDTINLRGVSYTLCNGEYYECEDDDELTGQIDLSFERGALWSDNLLSAYGDYSPLGLDRSAKIRVSAISGSGNKLSTVVEVRYDIGYSSYCFAWLDKTE